MESDDAANVSASGSARAQQLRASFGARRDYEALMAEASATREAAVAEADAIIQEAQQVSEQLLRETREDAERLTVDARSSAEELVSRARAEAEELTRQARAAADSVRARAEAQVEEHRRRVRVELTEQVTREVAEQSRRELFSVHERQQAMIGDLEASVRILGVSMEAAVANIAEMLSALDSLRVHAAESMGETAPPGGPPLRLEPLDHLIRATDVGPATPGREEPSESRVDADATAEEGDRQPRSATEAFLRSAHLDHGDPPLPPVDDDDTGARYAREAMRAAARAKVGRADPAPSAVLGATDVDPESESTGKPLGWLFRSP